MFTPKFGIPGPDGLVSTARHSIASHDATGSAVSHESFSSEVRCRGRTVAQLAEMGVVCADRRLYVAATMIMVIIWAWGTVT